MSKLTALNYVFSKDRDFQEFLKTPQANHVASALRVRRGANKDGTEQPVRKVLVRLIEYPKPEQLDRFAQEIEKKNLDKVIRKYVRKGDDSAHAPPDVIGLLEALLRSETQKPGSVQLRHLRGSSTQVLLVQDLSNSGILQGELKFHEV